MAQYVIHLLALVEEGLSDTYELNIFYLFHQANFGMKIPTDETFPACLFQYRIPCLRGL